MEFLLVMTNIPDAKSAKSLAARLVEQRLAACVNVLSPCSSTHRWQGKIESTEEVPVLIKTAAERYPALQAAIRKQHPYELPEIIAVSISGRLPAYLHWVAEETKQPQSC